MSVSKYTQIILKNILLAVVAFTLINVVLADKLGVLYFFKTIAIQSLIYGGLVGIAAATNEILIEQSIANKSTFGKFPVEKVLLTSAPLYYVRLMRVFLVGSVICLALTGIISSIEGASLDVYAQLAIVPVALALGANVPQTYSLHLKTNDNSQKALNIIKEALDQSMFSLERREGNHFLFKIADQGIHMYNYLLAPGQCTIELLVHHNSIEIIGAYSYLDRIIKAEHVNQIAEVRSQEEKVA